MGQEGVEPSILAEADFKSVSRLRGENPLFEQQTHLFWASLGTGLLLTVISPVCRLGKRRKACAGRCENLLGLVGRCLGGGTAQCCGTQKAAIEGELTLRIGFSVGLILVALPQFRPIYSRDLARLADSGDDRHLVRWPCAGDTPANLRDCPSLRPVDRVLHHTPLSFSVPCVSMYAARIGEKIVRACVALG